MKNIRNFDPYSFLPDRSIYIPFLGHNQRYYPSKIGAFLLSSYEVVLLNEKEQIPFSDTETDDYIVGNQYSRLLHVVAVANTARDLAKKFGFNSMLSEIGGLGHDVGHTSMAHYDRGFVDHHEINERVIEGLDPIPDGTKFEEKIFDEHVEYESYKFKDVLDEFHVSTDDAKKSLKLPTVEIADDLCYMIMDSDISGWGASMPVNFLFKNLRKWENGLYFSDDMILNNFYLSNHAELTKRYYNANGPRSKSAFLRRFIEALAEEFKTSPKTIAELTWSNSLGIFIHKFRKVWTKSIESNIGMNYEQIEATIQFPSYRGVMVYRLSKNSAGNLLDMKSIENYHQRKKVEKELSEKIGIPTVVDTTPITKPKEFNVLVKNKPINVYNLYPELSVLKKVNLELDDFRIFAYPGTPLSNLSDEKEKKLQKISKACEDLFGKPNQPITI